MAQLQITSERYLRVSSASVTVTEESSSSHCSSPGPCHARGPRRQVTHRKASFVTAQTGELDVAAQAGELSLRARTGLRVLVAGSAFYLYLPGTATPAGRPWVRTHLSAARAKAAFTALFPFHGDERAGASLGGGGPYAGLIDLLASASGGVRAAGSTVVQGQATREFDASVAPSRTSEPGSPYASQIVQRPGATEAVQAFIAESGLPLRVIVTVAAATDRVSQTTEIVAVNTQVHVTAPPARRTISARDFVKLSNKGGDSSSSSSGTQVSPRSKQ